MQEENEETEKEHSTVDYTLLDLDRMDSCKSIEFVKDNFIYAKGSEASIVEDVMDLDGIDYVKELNRSFKRIAEQATEDKEKNVSNYNSELNTTISRFMKKVNNDMLSPDNGEEVQDYMIEDIEYDPSDVISHTDIITCDEYDDSNEGIHVKAPNDVEYMDDMHSITERDSKQDIGNIIGIEEDIQDVEDEIVTGDTFECYGDGNNDGIKNVVKYQLDEEPIENDLLETYDSQKTSNATLIERISAELSRQSFQRDDLSGSESIKLEKSAVPKTPYHSATDFNKVEEEQEVPE